MIGRFGQQNNELLASVAGEHITFTKCSEKNFRNFLQDHVPHRVPIRIVELLEVIDIEENERNASFSPPYAGNFSFQSLMKIPPVEEPGEAIRGRQLFESFVDPGVLDSYGRLVA